MESRMDRGWGVAAALLALVVTAGPALAQAGPRMATRSELEARLDSLQRAASAERDSDARQDLTIEIGLVASRLRDGDIWPGDVVNLRVADEPRWSNRFTVTPDRRIDLECPTSTPGAAAGAVSGAAAVPPGATPCTGGGIAPINMAGVLQSELEAHLRDELSVYLREPEVRAELLRRIGVTGAVGAPGFYVVSGASLVSEVIMQAGGPASNAKVEKAEFRRMGDDIDFGQGQLVFQSHSIDQLGLRSGDEIYVPARGSSFGAILLGVVGAVGSLAFLISQI